MADYTGSSRPDELEALTALDDADLLVAFDNSDADSKTKKITKANFVADLADETQTLTNKTIDADNNTVSNIGDAEVKNDINADKIGAGTLLHERGGLEADISAYAGLIKITGGTTSQAVAGTDYAAATHASRHERAGADEIDGDHLDIDFTPSNYTPATTPAEAADVNDLAAHLQGIDTAIGSSSTATINWIMPLPGNTINGSLTEKTFTGNTTMIVCSFILPAAITVDEIGIRVSGTTGTDGVLSLAVYSEDGQTKHIDVDTGTIGDTGQNEFTAVSAVALAAGRYYFAVLPNSTMSIQLNRYSVIGASYSNGGPEMCGTITVTADTLPTTFDPTAITFVNSNSILFTLRAS